MVEIARSTERGPPRGVDITLLEATNRREDAAL
jgi:hypothetical protein